MRLVLLGVGTSEATNTTILVAQDRVWLKGFSPQYLNRIGRPSLVHIAVQDPHYGWIPSHSLLKYFVSKENVSKSYLYLYEL